MHEVSNGSFRFQYEGQDYDKGSFSSERKAIAEEAVLKSRVIEGKVLPASLRALTFSEGVEIWFSTNPPDKATQSLKNERARLGLAQRFFEKKRLTKLTQIQREDIEAFLASLSELRGQTRTLRRSYANIKISDHTRNHYLVLLKSLWNRLRRRKKFIGENPCEGIAKIKVNEARCRYLFPAEEKVLTPIVAKDSELYPYYFLALHTGCRIGELMRLRVVDADPILNRLFIGRGAEGQPTKSRRSRYIPVSDDLATYLTSRIEGRDLNEPLLPRWQYTYLRERFQAAVKKAGLREGLHFHDLRHTFAQRLLTKGVPIYKVSKILGHSTTVVTEKHYGFMATGDLAEGINFLNGVVSGAQRLQRVAEEQTQTGTLTGTLKTD